MDGTNKKNDKDCINSIIEMAWRQRRQNTFRFEKGGTRVKVTSAAKEKWDSTDPENKLDKKGNN